MSVAGVGGVASGRGSEVAFGGLAGAGCVSAPRGGGWGAEARRVDGWLADCLGLAFRDGEVGVGANGREGNASRRRRNGSGGRCRAERAGGIGDWGSGCEAYSVSVHWVGTGGKWVGRERAERSER